LHRQFFDFAGDNREAAPRFAPACCFDGGVEREQVGALRDRLDQLDDLADLIGRTGKF